MSYKPQNAGVELITEIFKRLYKMIKKLFFILSLFIVTNCLAQKRDTTLRNAGLVGAGNELIKFDRKFTTGLGMQLAGSILVGIGSAVDANNSSREPLIIGGGVLSLVGFFIQLTSSSHVRKAGIMLKQNKLVIPL